MKEGISILFKQNQIDKISTFVENSIPHDTDIEFVFLNLLFYTPRSTRKPKVRCFQEHNLRILTRNGLKVNGGWLMVIFFFKCRFTSCKAEQAWSYTKKKYKKIKVYRKSV